MNTISLEEIRTMRPNLPSHVVPLRQLPDNIIEEIENIICDNVNYYLLFRELITANPTYLNEIFLYSIDMEVLPLEVVNYFISKGLDINTVFVNLDSFDWNSIVSKCAERRQLETLDIFLSHKLINRESWPAIVNNLICGHSALDDLESYIVDYINKNFDWNNLSEASKEILENFNGDNLSEASEEILDSY